jgi:tetratricopeptide (TPR) repeat protein
MTPSDDRGRKQIQEKQHLPETGGDAQTQARDPAAVALQAKFNRGLALHQQGRLTDAERIYGEVLRQKPNHFDALHLLGVISLQTRRTERAVELIKKAIGLDSKSAPAHSNLGNALRDLKRPELASCDRAIALKPDYAVAYNNRGNALLDLKRPKDALESYDKAIALKPDYAEVYANRGNALLAVKRPDEALDSYDRAIALKPDLAEVYIRRGNALRKLKRPDEALVNYDKAIALKSDYAEAYTNRGNALRDLKRPEEALASHDKAIALKPNYAGAYWNRSNCLLLMGRFEQGFRQYEWRTKLKKPLGFRSYPQPLWLGEENIVGKTLFIYWEQGLGDTILFCRYAKLAEARGAKVVLSVQKPLRGLLKQVSPTIQVIGPTEAPAVFDYHSPLLSLPLALRTTLEKIPAEHHYLKAENELRLAWSARLPPKTKPRIGVVWSGDVEFENDHYRSMELQQFLPICSMDADWTCLQKEVREKDLAVLRQASRIAHFGDDLGDFSNTAALLDLMDLVITVDTNIAHLAGAMGKHVWVLLSSKSHWIWLLNRDDSPWYPSARLFRQQQIGNWAGVIDQVRDKLRSVIF